MATLLYRLGRFAFRRRRLVLAGWLVVLLGAAVAAATLSGATSDSFSIPGTPAQKAIDTLGQRFPQASVGGATARVVFAAPSGKTLTDPASRKVIERAVTQLRAAPQVAAVTDPFVNKAFNATGTVGFAQASYTVQSSALTQSARDALGAVAAQARSGGLRVEVGGDAVKATPATGATEMLGVLVAALVLAITFGSLIAAGIPLFTALLGIAIGVAGITALTGFVDLSSNTPTLALMIGLAVGIDYALFIVSRYRHEVATGRDAEEAAGRAVGTAGSAVVFAGLTVVIALAALSVVGIPFITQMGLAAAATVALAVLIALTLLPAVLGIAGRHITGGRIPGLKPHDPEADPDAQQVTPNFGTRWARAIARRPLTGLLIAVALLGVIAVPALDLRLGMPDDSSAAPSTTQRKAYDLISSGFGPGFNGPLTVLVESTPPTVAGATGASRSVQAAADQVAQRVRGLQDVAVVTPAVLNPAGDTALLTVIPLSGPSTTATEDLVRAVRRLDGTAAGVRIGVTGLTAINIDISAKLSGALLPYLTVVVGLAFVLLMLVFRSVLVPLKAAAGFLLSIAATFGAVVAVFQWGWLDALLGVEQTGPLISLLPIFLIGIVFGLAMDYEVFLVSRMQRGARPRR